tara:strand:+ start:39490 stop:39699 length:210 start_codon:yes stop_codon:yes gene_type:complete
MNKITKKIKEYFGLLLITLGIISIFYPSMYWFINDDLTKMELFKEFWYVLPLSIFLLVSGDYLADTDLL